MYSTGKQQKHHQELHALTPWNLFQPLTKSKKNQSESKTTRTAQRLPDLSDFPVRCVKLRVPIPINDSHGKHNASFQLFLPLRVPYRCSRLEGSDKAHYDAQYRFYLLHLTDSLKLELPFITEVLIPAFALLNSLRLIESRMPEIE